MFRGVDQRHVVINWFIRVRGIPTLAMTTAVGDHTAQAQDIRRFIQNGFEAPRSRGGHSTAALLTVASPFSTATGTTMDVGTYYPNSLNRSPAV